jgi:hypothetical protein
VVTLDPGRFPRAAAYLATLPHGLESHPGCKVRDVVLEPYVRSFAALAGEPGLPVPVADMLTGRLTSPWLSEVLFQVSHLVVRDRGFDEDGAMLDWTLKANAQVFDKPILRNLMRLVSPTLVVLGATKRWSAFHMGSDLTADRVVESGGRAGATAHLKYPPGLFSPLFLVTLERSFVAALMASRAREPQAKAMAEGTERGLTDYAVSWRV